MKKLLALIAILGYFIAGPALNNSSANLVLSTDGEPPIDLPVNVIS